MVHSFANFPFAESENETESVKNDNESGFTGVQCTALPSEEQCQGTRRVLCRSISPVSNLANQQHRYQSRDTRFS